MVPCRLRSAAGLAALTVAAVLAIAASITQAAPAPQDLVYRLRGDPRLCPSPVCGGFWVTRVNAVHTRCADDTDRAACYVAAVDVSALPPAQQRRLQGVLERSLVRGRYAPADFEGFPQLRKLAVDEAWLAATSAPWAGVVYRVVDTGRRCITSPCYSLRAARVNGVVSVRLSDLDLSGVRAPTLTARARATLKRGRLLVAGVVRAVPDAGPAGTGRVLAATQFWLSP
jgi:Domain of unknown function (DUF6748)